MATRPLKLAPRLKALPGLVGAIRFSKLLELPEEEFAPVVSGLEEDPLFRQLRQQRVLRYERPDNTRWAFAERVAEAAEERAAAGADDGVVDLLGEHAPTVELIRKAGRAAFERYFVYPDEPRPDEEIAGALGLRVDEVRAVRGLVEDAMLRGLAAPGPASRAAAGPGHALIAEVHEEEGQLTVHYTSVRSARGRYAVDDAALSAFRKGARLDADGKRRLQDVLETVELVNLRHQTVHRILTAVIERQQEYLRGADEGTLRPWAQKELAAELGATPSAVCRAIGGRAVRTPWGEEVAIKTLIPSRKAMCRRWVRSLLEEDPKATDEQLRQRLQKKFQVRVSRRSVNVYAQGQRL